MSSTWICHYFIFQLTLMFIVVVSAVERFPALLCLLLFGTVIFYSVAPFHKVPRRIVLAKCYKVHSIETILTIDLWKWLYISDSLHISNAKTYKSNIDMTTLFKIIILVFTLMFGFSSNIGCWKKGILPELSLYSISLFPILNLL